MGDTITRTRCSLCECDTPNTFSPAYYIITDFFFTFFIFKKTNKQKEGKSVLYSCTYSCFLKSHSTTPQERKKKNNNKGEREREEKDNDEEKKKKGPNTVTSVPDSCSV